MPRFDRVGLVVCVGLFVVASCGASDRIGDATATADFSIQDKGIVEDGGSPVTVPPEPSATPDGAHHHGSPQLEPPSQMAAPPDSEPSQPAASDVPDPSGEPHVTDDGSLAYEPRTRTYFIAAEEVDWDYAPDGSNVAMGRPFNDEEKVFVEGNGRDRIGSVYRKALYHEYTDETFTTPKPRAAADAYLGMLGPIVHGVVGDTLKVVFRNAGNRHYSIHAHGVLYDKGSEGAETNDGTAAQDKLDDMVEPGDTFTYTWRVVERSGPGPADPSSIVWLYHSHIDDGIADEYAGLIGAIVITDAAHGTESGVASDVDREAVSLFLVDDENTSLFIDENVQRFAPDAVLDDDGFIESNLMHSLNGYVFANGPRFCVKQGARVRWYLLTLGTEVDLHTPHWHGNTVLDRGHRTDVVELLPASMRTVDMVPDNPGVWMFHCHVNDHIAAGMMTLFEVLP
jgi:FtsP/CotA-like multicopper oxidase with cupredoxin domain